MYKIPNRGQGACGFISLRTALELHRVLDNIERGQKTPFVMNGYDADMMLEAFKLRTSVVGFYLSDLQAEVPQLGDYTFGGRMWRRIDLLALEMVKSGKDVPEEGPEREKLALQYLKAMSMPGAWMSTPEYTATALMAKKKVVVYQNGAEINSVNEECGGRPLNLFFRGNHYEAIITEQEKIILEREYGENFLPSLVPV
jgi:hypothetical protein